MPAMFTGVIHFFLTTFPTKPQLRHLHFDPSPECFRARPHFGHLSEAIEASASRAIARRMERHIDMGKPPLV